MGLKRPLDAEAMKECNAKHARQLSYNDKQLNQSDEAIPYHDSLEKTCLLVEDLSGLCEKKPTFANHVEKEFDNCAPFSWISTGLCQEEFDRTQSSLSHGSEFTWRPLSPVENLYSYLMNRSPLKAVPVGSDYQADIPECVLDRSEGKLMGKCIIPMPDSDVCGTGQGRKDCLCPDKGSVRCVRRHIVEAREYLIETIGCERFMDLGFYELGEEVASLWTEDEEDLFHKIVYSNPASLGRDFWKQLKATFPSRTMSELVSYYFNVFILRRRATQNRYKTLDIDSDDDEWHVEYDVFHSAKSCSYEDDNNRRSSSDEDSEEEEEETNSNDDDNEECGNGDGSEEEESPSDDGNFVYNKDKVSKDGVGGEEGNVEDDSCMSFELQESTNLVFSHNNRSGDDDDDSYSFDDGRLALDCWTKNSDLLPTSNIIEELFGQDEWRDYDNNLKGK